jgi:hypothetical protein
MGPKIWLDDVEYRKFSPLPDLELRPLGHPARSQTLYRLLCTLFPTLLETCIAKEYRLDSRGSIRGKARDFSALHSVKTGSKVHPASHSMFTGDSFRGIRRLRRETGHSLPG